MMTAILSDVIYNWSSDIKCSLSLEIGDTVHIVEEYSTDWYRGYKVSDQNRLGIFPKSYIVQKSCKLTENGGLVPIEDDLVREIAQVVREWCVIWKKLFTANESYKFQAISNVMPELIKYRHQLINDTIANDQIRDFKLKIVSKIDWGNRKLGLDLVPRIGHNIVSPDSMSVVKLYDIFVTSSDHVRDFNTKGTLRLNRTEKPKPKLVFNHSLYFCVRDFGYTFSEDLKCYFSLFDFQKQRFFSERFLMRVSKDGFFARNINPHHSNCTIFMDLGNMEQINNLYIVVNVARIGKIFCSDGGKKLEKGSSSVQTYKRPYGVAVLNLAAILSSKDFDLDEKIVSFKLYQCDEKDFSLFHENLINNKSGKFSFVSGQTNFDIKVSLKLIKGEPNDGSEDSSLLCKNVCFTKKLGFPEIIMPGDFRNDMYLVLEKGEFERGGRSTGKNIEVTVVVLDSNRKTITNCIYESSASEAISNYNSMIFYHSNTPNWQENVRITIPVDLFSASHVRLEFRHCSTKEKNDKKLIGFSFIRLMDSDGAVIKDGYHELYVYKCEDYMKLVSTNYLVQPYGENDMQHDAKTVQPFSRNPKEQVVIRTILCSTKLTQNGDLLEFLRWKSQPDRIQQSLTRILTLDCEELVKFLQDVLDALFALFSNDEGNSTSHSGLVFRTLIFILNSLNRSKFEHFKPVLDAYIQDHFASPLICKGFLSSIKFCTIRIATTDNQEAIQEMFRCLGYLFKFIIRSRYLFLETAGASDEKSFCHDLSGLFDDFNEMLSKPFPSIIHSQIIFLQSISSVFDHLLDIFPPVQVTKIAINIIEALPKDSNSPLNMPKLTALKRLVSGTLFDDNESRSLLILTACRHLSSHFANGIELQTCTEILGEIIGFLFEKLHSGQYDSSLEHNIDILCVNILLTLVETIAVLMERKNKTILPALIACLMGLFQLLNQFHYEHFWEELLKFKGDPNILKTFLQNCFDVFNTLIRQEIYPNYWFFIRMVINQKILNVLNFLKEPLVFKFLNEFFDKKLWNRYFHLAVSYMVQDTLQLERFTTVKKEKILEKYGDLRISMSNQLLSLWTHLKEKKIYFIPSIVGPFLEISLLDEPQIRKTTLLIFYDMMECEQKIKGNFKQFEIELVDKLDSLISENKGDDNYRQLFQTVLIKKFEIENIEWKDSALLFVNAISKLLELLLDYRTVSTGEENRDKRMFCTVNILNFYKNEFNCKEMYLRYIYKLYDMHLLCDNYTEAAFTMKMYADQLSWTSDSLLSDPNYHNYPESKVKEILYLQIIQNFDKGKCWEKGIPLCKELAEIYETKLFNYEALSSILKTQAQFYDNILSQLRPEPEYFRVGFYGLKCPTFFRNRQFIYRGLEYERIGSFTQRIQIEFPNAQILMKNSPPDDSILNADNQFIQISNVKPISESDSLIFMKQVPENISKFYRFNNVKKFQFDRPIHKGPIDKENEFKSMWIERTLLISDNPLPGILKWFEVIKKHTQELPPVQFACETVQNIDCEIRKLIDSYSNEPKQNLSPFTMRLQGVIDANVQGGISKYQSAFFTADFMKDNPDLCPFVHKLKALIFDVIQTVEKGLLLHDKLATHDLKPLHQRLVERFAQLKFSLSSVQKLKKQQCDIINTPLPPLPYEKKYSNFNNSEINNDHIHDYDDIYSKLVDKNQNVESYCAPPLPQREPKFDAGRQLCVCKEENRSTTANSGLPDDNRRQQQETQQVLISSHDESEAPPLPPKGLVPDKKKSMAHTFSRRNVPNFDSLNDNCIILRQNGQNDDSSILSIGNGNSFNNSIVGGGSNSGIGGNNNFCCNGNNDLRDSGISTTSSLLDDNYLSPLSPPVPPAPQPLHSSLSSSSIPPTLPPPPPIPPKPFSVLDKIPPSHHV